MANLLKSLLRRSEPEIVRYTVDDYIRMLTQNRMGLMQSYGPAVSYAGGRPAEQVENSFTGYVSGAYKSNPIVYGVMRKRSSVFSEARFVWRRIDENGRPGELFADEALDILRRPWPNGTTGELLARMIQDADLAGNFYAVREGTRIRRLRPDWVQIVLTGDPRTETDVDVFGYVYTAGGPESGKSVAYTPDEVCHWSPDPDPEALYRGQSWLTPVVKEIQGDSAAADHKIAFFRNGATLGPIIKVPAGLTPTQFKEFIQASNEAHVGSDNAYRPMYVGGGADVTLAAATMQQLDFKGLQGASETRICVAGQTPAVIAGVSEGLAGSSLNAGNYQAAKRAWVDGTLRPLWRSACAALASIVDEPPDAELWFDERDIAFLREDQQDLAQIQQTQAATINSYVTGGWVPASAVEAVIADDLTKLKHSGLTSVQLVPPGGPDANGDGVPDEEAADEGAEGAPTDDPFADFDFDTLRADLVRSDEELDRAYKPLRHAKGMKGGGRFRKLSDSAVPLLKEWAKGSGSADPLGDEGFSRDQLRTILRDIRQQAEESGDGERAKRLTPRRGASEGELKAMLYADASGKPMPEAPKKETAGKTYATDAGGRISQEEAGRQMLGDAEYERRQAAKAAKKAPAKTELSISPRTRQKMAEIKGMVERDPEYKGDPGRKIFDGLRTPTGDEQDFDDALNAGDRDGAIAAAVKAHTERTGKKPTAAQKRQIEANVDRQIGIEGLTPERQKAVWQDAKRDLTEREKALDEALDSGDRGAALAIMVADVTERKGRAPSPAELRQMQANLDSTLGAPELSEAELDAQYTEALEFGDGERALDLRIRQYKARTGRDPSPEKLDQMWKIVDNQVREERDRATYERDRALATADLDRDYNRAVEFGNRDLAVRLLMREFTFRTGEAVTPEKKAQFERIAELAIRRQQGQASRAQRYRHGWIPVSPLVLLPPDAIDDEFGRVVDGVDVGEARITARENGVTVESTSGEDIAIHARPSSADIERWAEAIESGEPYSRPRFAYEPHDGGAVVRFGNLELDLDDDEVDEAAQALRDMLYVVEDAQNEPDDDDVVDEPPGDETPIPDVERAGRGRSNPAPGRQVISAEGSDQYGLPIGFTIPPGTRKLTQAQQAALKALPAPERARYMQARKDGATHTAALKASGAAPVKAAKKAAKAAPRKATPAAKAAPATPAKRVPRPAAADSDRLPGETPTAYKNRKRLEALEVGLEQAKSHEEAVAFLKSKPRADLALLAKEWGVGTHLEEYDLDKKGQRQEGRPATHAELAAWLTGAHVLSGGGRGWPGMQPSAAELDAAAARRLQQGLDGLSSDPAVRVTQIENRMRAAFQSMQPGPGRRVDVEELRLRAGSDARRVEVDEALRRLTSGEGNSLTTEGLLLGSSDLRPLPGASPDLEGRGPEGLSSGPTPAGPTRRGRRNPGAFFPLEVYFDSGEDERVLRERLDSLDIEQLRDIIAENGMDPARSVSQSKDRQKLIDRIVSLTQSRATKGDAFLDRETARRILGRNPRTTAVTPSDSTPDLTGARGLSSDPSVRAAARERNRHLEQASGTAAILAEMDQLLARKADAATIRQRLDPALIEREGPFGGADPAVLEGLAAVADDPAKLRAAITRLSTKAKIKPISRSGAKVTFDPDQMEPLPGVDIEPGSKVTVVSRGSSVTLPDGTVVPLQKAVVAKAAEIDPSDIVADGSLTPAQKRARLRARGMSKEQIDALVPLPSRRATRSAPLDDDVVRAEEPDEDDEDDPDGEEIQALADEDDEDEVERAAGRDTTPGNDQLHHYWTKGPGLARWAESATPWRTLLANLVEEVEGKPLETLKKWTSRWFIEVFGYAAGSDKHRVAHGKPPRGDVVGPG